MQFVLLPSSWFASSEDVAQELKYWEEFAVPYAQTEDGVLHPPVHGKPASKTICPNSSECKDENGQPVEVVYHRESSDGRRAHFVHKRSTNCNVDRATHAIAIKLIVQTVQQWVAGGDAPQISFACKKCEAPIVLPLRGDITSAREAVRLTDVNRQADVELLVGETVVELIEVFRTHEVDKDKRAALRKGGYSWIEIDAQHILDRPTLWPVRQSGVEKICAVCVDAALQQIVSQEAQLKTQAATLHNLRDENVRFHARERELIATHERELEESYGREYKAQTDLESLQAVLDEKAHAFEKDTAAAQVEISRLAAALEEASRATPAELRDANKRLNSENSRLHAENVRLREKLLVEASSVAEDSKRLSEENARLSEENNRLHEEIVRLTPQTGGTVPATSAPVTQRPAVVPVPAPVAQRPAPVPPSSPRPAPVQRATSVQEGFTDYEDQFNWDALGDVPPGSYDLILTHAEYQPTRKDQKHMVVAKFTVVAAHEGSSAEAVGRTCKSFLPFGQDNSFRTKNFLDVTGIAAPSSVNRHLLEQWAASIRDAVVGGIVRPYRETSSTHVDKFVPTQGQYANGTH